MLRDGGRGTLTRMPFDDAALSSSPYLFGFGGGAGDPSCVILGSKLTWLTCKFLLSLRKLLNYIYIYTHTCSYVSVYINPLALSTCINHRIYTAAVILK